MPQSAVTHDCRDDQGHGQDVRAQVVAVQAWVQRDVLAEADDRRRAFVRPRAGIGRAIEHGNAEAVSRLVQPDQRIAWSEHGLPGGRSHHRLKPTAASS
jgi:hypothetical protein